MNKRKDVIPNNLKEYRLKCGYTQRQVATLLGFTNEVSICHWEQGKNVPGLVNLFKICGIYNTSPSNLYNELSKSILENFTSSSNN